MWRSILDAIRSAKAVCLNADIGKGLISYLEERVELLSIGGLPFGSSSCDAPLEGKPYPTEHACRLNDPGKYDRFARKNCFKRHDGKCIDFIFGIKEGKSETQAMRYPKKTWDVADARSHCKEAGGRFEAASEEE